MADNFFLDLENTALIIIDFQEKLSLKMKHRKRILENIKRLIAASKILNFPLILTEQYPKGVGPTEKDIVDMLPEYKPLEKTSFSCCRDEQFTEELKKLEGRSLVLVGIEAHVCVLQTALDCLKAGYRVHVPSDGVASRSKLNWETSLQMMRDAGVVITCTETVIFQLLKKSGTKEFKELLPYIK